MKIWMSKHHRLRPIDTHLVLFTMLYNNSAKNRYAEPVRNKNKANIRKSGINMYTLFGKKKTRRKRLKVYVCTFFTASN